ncbi:MAG: cellulase family glycosylhydrolase [Clostridia bacterium]|nr:cellulase family glycosylhydrolase [Clostridia bacterium]
MKKKNVIILAISFLCIAITFLLCTVCYSKDNRTRVIVRDVHVAHHLVNTWIEGNENFAQYEFKITNYTNKTIDDFEIDYNLVSDTRVINVWDAAVTSEGKQLIIKPTDYNKVINKNSFITFGIILASKNEKIFSDDMYCYDVFVNDKKYETKEVLVKNINYENDIALDSENNSNTNTNNDIKIEINYDENIPDNTKGSPVSLHGALSVKGTNIVDEKGNTFIIQGVSTHGIAWFPDYVNYDTFKTLRDDMNVNTIRLAMYSDPNSGYKKEMHELVKKGVSYATKLGMYVIIDWHILNDNNPNIYKDNAKSFFSEMSNLYKDNNNVIYEICNEPNGNVTWQNDIMPYAKEMIEVIRKNDKDAIIIVGTPTWSQDVDIVAQNKLEGYTNICYALHFYAATHKDDLRNKYQKAIKLGLPILVSEFGICDASGNGAIDEDSANTWINLLRSNGTGYICWNLSNKNESSSLISSSSNKLSDFTDNDLSYEGKWLKKTYKNIK